MRIAYLDEFPWARCDCGWTVNGDDDHPCMGCGKTENPERRDRFGLAGETRKDVMGREYPTVAYEDELRKEF